MIPALDRFRGFDICSIFLRLVLAMLFGGIIGLEGARKGRPAGFRTYMLVCLGAALTMLLGQYEEGAVTVLASDQFPEIRADAARFGAQVINGVGFLGAGTIIVTGKQQVKGLTTAAALWASACVGLAVGAAFYECYILALLLVFLIVRILPRLEERLSRNMRNIHIYIEYDQMEHTGLVLNHIRELGAQIYEVELDRQGGMNRQSPCAVFTVRLHKRMPHSQVLAHISQLEYIRGIEEV